ncbi:MAG: BolA family protein [Stenotrophobium sp.]
MTRIEKIRAALEAAFAPAEIIIEDENHLHTGHAGAAKGHGHFRVTVISAAFAGQPLLARHRRVYAALGALMQTDIHALSINARTPQE